MNTQFISALLVSIPLLAAVRQHPQANLARYLWSSLVYVPFVWTASSVWGDWTWQYATVYCLFTALILASIFRIAWDCLSGRHYKLRPIAAAGILALVLAKVALAGMQGQWAWISVSEGFLLAWAGILTAFSGAHRPRSDVYVPLGMFWTLQAGFSFGWALHGQQWEQFNWILPPLMGFCCFSYLSWRLGQRAAVEHLS